MKTLVRHPAARRGMTVDLGMRATVSLLVVAISIAAPAGVRALRAQEPGTWKSLFNGKDLTGWTVVPRSGAAPTADAAGAAAPSWKVENGVLIGGQAPPGTRGPALQTVEHYKDFELELDFLLAEHGTQCSAELVGPEQANASVEKSCLYNSGINMRTGYQLNIGRREAGEFIGVVIHRVAPGAIRRNVLWLDKGDEKFPDLRKKEDWNHLQVSFKGPRLQVSLNGTKICDVTDNPADPAEARWKEAGQIGIQWPHASAGGEFEGSVKYRNIRIRQL
jgi:hypothetical protein